MTRGRKIEVSFSEGSEAHPRFLRADGGPLHFVEWLRPIRPAEPTDDLPDGWLIVTIEAYSPEADETITLEVVVAPCADNPNLPDWASIRPDPASQLPISAPTPTATAPSAARGQRNADAGVPAILGKWRRAICLGCDGTVVRARDGYVSVGGTLDGSWLTMWPTGPDRFAATGPIPDADIFILGISHRGCTDRVRIRAAGQTLRAPDELIRLYLDDADDLIPTLHLPADDGTCPFCNTTTNLSDEHVWPKWVSKELRFLGRALAPRQGRGPAKHQIEVTVPVCTVCNNDWMSVLENDVAAIMRPMFRGYRVQLGPAEQGVLATWATKTAFMIDRVENGVVPRGFAIDLAMTRRPPVNSRVFVGAYTGDFAAKGVSQPLLIGYSDGTKPSEPNAVVTTFTAYNVAFQVVTHFNKGPMTMTDTRTGLNRTFTQLWPTATESLEWPPEFVMHDTGFDAFATSISDSTT
jgi:hypothetical protein